MQNRGRTRDPKAQQHMSCLHHCMHAAVLHNHRAAASMYAQLNPKPTALNPKPRGGSGLHLLAAGLAAVRQLQLLAANRLCTQTILQGDQNTVLINKPGHQQAQRSLEQAKVLEAIAVDSQRTAMLMSAQFAMFKSITLLQVCASAEDSRGPCAPYTVTSRFFFWLLASATDSSSL